MSNFIKTQNSFAHGEVSPTFYTHDNIHGLSRMENMDVLSGGGLSRRFGLQHIMEDKTMGIFNDNFFGQ